MLAPFPPNSRDTLLTLSAAPLVTATPALVDPVKLTISISGWLLIASPTVGPSPFTRLNTPFGKPASCIISANKSEDIGAISEGFKTTEQPTATAGMTFKVT